MEIVVVAVCTSRVVKKNSTYHFVRKSAYFALKIELLLTMMSKFERVKDLKAQLSDG